MGDSGSASAVGPGPVVWLHRLVAPSVLCTRSYTRSPTLRLGYGYGTRDRGPVYGFKWLR